MEDNEYKEALQLYDKLESKNKKMKEAGVHDYSLINALLKASDEVNLHSKFIYSMVNPAGLHYCGNAFLKLFLEEINCESFFCSKQVKDVEVFREKGNIDLLIHDGNKFIIIENKLNADDQPHQITRYIKYVKDRFLPHEDDLSDKIQIVYLAKNKSYPERESLIGFKRIEDENVVEWIGIDKDVPEKLTGFTLKSGTKIPYIHINYQNNIQHWVSESRETDECKSKNLFHVFDEYELVLKRLNSKKPWRNIMELSEYCFRLEDGKDKDKLYQFMSESRVALPKLISKEITELFKTKLDSNVAQPLFDVIFSEHDIENSLNADDFYDNCLYWLNRKKKSKNIGLVLVDKDGRYWCFFMGIINIYFGQVELTEEGEICAGQHYLKKNRISNRNKLLNKNGLIDLKEKVKLILHRNFECPEVSKE